ncbi:MAG: putative rane protein [Parachlamydiales bacterium]|nr:putative rane protein [Parachlamydiales bacterium]
MIYEIKTILELIPHLDDDCWLFLDLDNTIIESVNEFGSDAWEKSLIQQHLAMGVSEEIAHQRSSLIWSAMQTVSPVRLVQQEIRELFDFIHKKNIPYKFLTARSKAIINTTERQLDFIGIHQSFSEPEDLLFEENKCVVCKGKVIYCSDTSKGSVLQQFFKIKGIIPNKVIFVDDCISHLLNAQSVLESINSFVGLRYGYLDEKMKSYQPDTITEIINQVFLNVEAAELMLKGLLLPLHCDAKKRRSGE